MTLKFYPDREGIKALKAEPSVRAYTTLKANEAAAVAKLTAPVRTGRYQRSIAARQTGYKYAKARVYTDDFKAWWIEYGAGPSPVRGGRIFRARHTLGRACRAVGLRFVDLGRAG